MDRGMQMGEVGRVEPVASLPGPSGLDLEAIEARVKAASPGPWTTCNPESAFKNWPIGFFSLGRDEAAEPKNWAVSTDHVRASEMTSGGSREDAEFIAHARQDIPALLAEVRRLRAAEGCALPEPALGEGSPSHPSPRCAKCELSAWDWMDGKRICHYCRTPFPTSGPSQDSQEVREAVHRLLRSYRCQHTKDEDGDGASLLDVLSPGETVAGGLAEIELLTDEIAETVALLSQSPKGAAGADVRNLVKAAAAAMEDIEIGDLMEWPKGLALVDALAPFNGEGGESGPSAPKTGLRGAPRQEEKDFSPQWTCMGCGNMERGTFRTIEHRGDPAEPVDYDLECTKCGNLDIAESPEEALSRLTTDCDTLRAENETLKAAKPPLSPKGEGSLPSSPSSPEAAEGGAT